MQKTHISGFCAALKEKVVMFKVILSPKKRIHCSLIETIHNAEEFIRELCVSVCECECTRVSRQERVRVFVRV